METNHEDIGQGREQDNHHDCTNRCDAFFLISVVWPLVKSILGVEFHS